MDKEGSCAGYSGAPGTVIESPHYGDSRGTYFVEVKAPYDKMEVVGFHFNYGWYIDGIQLQYYDGNTTFWGDLLGMAALASSSQLNWTVNSGAHINKIRVTSNTSTLFFTGLQFFCTDGSVSPLVGGHDMGLD